MMVQCGGCGQAVEEDHKSINCEAGCSKWFHWECTSLTELAITSLGHTENTMWVCEGCILTKRIPTAKKVYASQLGT